LTKFASKILSKIGTQKHANLLAKWAVKKSKISKMGIVTIKIDY